MSLLITSLDSVVSHTVKERIGKENQQQRSRFHPFTLTQQAYFINLDASGRTVSNIVKRIVESEVKRKHLEHSTSLSTHGKLFQIIDTNASTIRSKVIQALPPSGIKFALNTASDALPHNANLAWWRVLSDDCNLCGVRLMLNHIFNHCKEVLELRRFNTRHDQVLRIITDFVKKQVPDDMRVVVALKTNTISHPVWPTPTCGQT